MLTTILDTSGNGNSGTVTSGHGGVVWGLNPGLVCPNDLSTDNQSIGAMCYGAAPPVGQGALTVLSAGGLGILSATNYTIEWWGYYFVVGEDPAAIGTHNFGGLVYSNVSSNSGFNYQGQASTKALVGVGVTNRIPDANNTLINNTYHFVFTWNAGTQTGTYYRNAVLVGSANQSAPGDWTGFGLGYAFDANGGDWTGIYDEVAVYPGLIMSGARVGVKYTLGTAAGTSAYAAYKAATLADSPALYWQMNTLTGGGGLPNTKRFNIGLVEP